MMVSSGALLEYQGNRIYVLNVVTNWFKKYIVGLNLTQSFVNNANNLSVVILFHVSGNIYEHVTDDALFDTVFEKSVKELQKNNKDVVNMLSDASGNRASLTEKDRAVIREYLTRVMGNKKR